ncbi:serine/threonine-protein kinase [Actinomadura sp. DC4]|uniref:serine/threonine-protein kinase n=1 Tax=Actinomadura sp. DC4 TaxID=3055069 RepID=UPI0025AED372|nr:serine/threonine-protein kinase [Actinomadura sp. DC4]MDN3356194.1 serine/threonine-protein kinase [Actinomadura sp. DC4]
MISGYLLRARLGMGGMGRVYLSFTPGGRAIAIKVLRPEFAEDDEFRRRFRQEVAAAQRVQGIYTAPVVDSDAEAALPWLATAYVPGPSLQEAVAEHGPLPVPTVCRLLAGAAEALITIHAAGLVHRDLKPANVLLADDGPRVIDFGITHAAESTSATRTGVRVGTPTYMAPEQILGRPVTSRTDVFALGQLTMYAATGRTAFGEGHQDALFYRIINESPELGGCPDALRDLLERCLAKQDGERPAPQEIVEFARAQTAGQTMRIAPWLPPVIADAFASFAASAVPLPPPPPGPPPTYPTRVFWPVPPPWPRPPWLPPPPKRAWRRGVPVPGVIAIAIALVVLVYVLAAVSDKEHSGRPPSASALASRSPTVVYEDARFTVPGEGCDTYWDRGVTLSASGPKVDLGSEDTDDLVYACPGSGRFSPPATTRPSRSSPPRRTPPPA